MNSSIRTAFVFAGGGSFGAIQVGMLRALTENGTRADLVVGSSVGAMNAAYFAADPTQDGVIRLARLWSGIRRQDVFPITLSTVAGFFWRGDFLVSDRGICRLIRTNLSYGHLEQAKIPVHVVTTDIISGETVVFSEGAVEDAIVATTAIPGAFAPVKHDGRFLSDGAISSNTPVRIAIAKGATRLVILPTGYACANQSPPVGAVANAIHALTLLIARQLTEEIESIPNTISYSVVPPLCPLLGSPYDFSMTEKHMERGGIPDAMRPHKHAPE